MTRQETRSTRKENFWARYALLSYSHSISHVTFAILKGGFAHCYELIDVDTNAIYAGKIVPKSMLTKPHQREKVIFIISICNAVSAVFVEPEIGSLS